MICSVYWILVFIFYFLFFLKNLWACFTCLPSIGLFFCLDWVCFTFMVDVELFCELALLQIFFFSDFSKFFLI